MTSLASHSKLILSAVALIAVTTFCFSDFASLVSFAQEAAAEAAPEAAAEAATEAAPAEAAPAEAAPEPDATSVVNFALTNTILLISAVLVLLMQAGFALVEVGLNSAKNAVNILAKNVLDLCLGAVLYFTIGYALMYPGSAFAGKYFGLDTSRIFTIPDYSPGAFLDPQIDFLFQVAFAATAATIVSGAVAGRMKFGAYLIYTVVITGFVYPISGMWKWGGGWLQAMGFWDFAGSGLVHMLGGVAGLAGAIALGPRIGRYTADGKSVPIPGHNITFTTLGVFILLIGWYGFNPGSQFGAPVAQLGIADMSAYGKIATNTTLAACTGTIAALVLAWGIFGKPDLTMGLNGMLGGLVGITANCDCVSNVESLVIGLVAGVLVFFAVIALDRLKIDDPVGAFPVHGVCGAWALIACALFGDKPMVAQLVGTAAIAAWGFVTMFILFMLLKAVGMLRVSPEEEKIGLDIGEHGLHAYPADPG